MCKEVFALVTYLSDCLANSTYYVDCADSCLVNIARKWLMSRDYSQHDVYNVWFAMRELIIKKFTAEPTVYDVIQTALKYRSEYCKVDPDDEFDWNYDCNNYACVKTSILYHLEGIYDHITNTCCIAKKFRQDYIDNNLYIDFPIHIAPIKFNGDVYTIPFHTTGISSNIAVATIGRCIIYDDKFVTHDYAVQLHKYLKKYCVKTRNFFKYAEKNPGYIDLIDIAGVIISDAYFAFCGYEKEMFAAHMVWYAVKFWSMLSSDKTYHEIDEIQQLLSTYNIPIDTTYKFESREFKDMYKNATIDKSNSVAYCIQFCEKMLDKYIHKFNRHITRVDLSDIPFSIDTPQKDTKTYYSYGYTCDNWINIKDRMNTFIDLFCKVNPYDHYELSQKDIDDFNKCKDIWNHIVIDEPYKSNNSSDCSSSE